MDFSSIPRALESLRRRQPSLSDRVAELSNEIPLEADPSKFLSLLDELLHQRDTSGVTSTSIHQVRWEPLAVGLYIATEVLQQTVIAHASGKREVRVSSVYVEGPRVPATRDDTDAAAVLSNAGLSIQPLSMASAMRLCDMLHPIAMEHMEHDEPRVRTLVAKAVGSYCRVSSTLCPSDPSAAATLNDGGVEIAPEKQRQQASMRREIFARLTDSIHDHLEKGRGSECAGGDPNEVEGGFREREETEDSKKYSRDSSGALDDTTGWRALETNWQCLAALVSAMGDDYWTEFPIDDAEGKSDLLLRDCQKSAVEHLNRHVRAAAMLVLEKWVASAASSAESAARNHAALITDPTSLLRTTTVAVLNTGLADNWSQVRMAANVLCRVFLTTHQRIAGEESVNDMYPTILPRMCLNRFYLAQGVRLYSHETWKMVMKDRGQALVAQYLPACCRYYVKMADADNHAVREAACQAIAELATRLGENPLYHDQLKDHIDTLLQALLMAFHDESWPVRDEACLACGILCRSYPEECRPELKTLWGRWTEQLTDQIWSVRQNAAVGLGYGIQAYGPEFLGQVRDLIKKLLPSARDQPAMSRDEYKAHMNDMEAHTGTQLYSCGSLAPKLRKGGAGRIGCSSCNVDGPKAPWEATDGCIYLIRELCIICCSTDGEVATREDIKLTDKDIMPIMRELADICRVQHFPQSSDLRTTLWRQLPAMARALGKQRFKSLYLETFLDLLFSNLESRGASQLSIHAAGQCAAELSDLVGPSIFRGRLDDYQRETYDRIMRERAMMPKGPTDETSFSPYGPAAMLESLRHGPTGTPGNTGPTGVAGMSPTVFPGRG